MGVATIPTWAHKPSLAMQRFQGDVRWQLFVSYWKGHGADRFGGGERGGEQCGDLVGLGAVDGGDRRRPTHAQNRGSGIGRWGRGCDAEIGGGGARPRHAPGYRSPVVTITSVVAPLDSKSRHGWQTARPAGYLALHIFLFLFRHDWHGKMNVPGDCPKPR